MNEVNTQTDNDKGTDVTQIVRGIIIFVFTILAIANLFYNDGEKPEKSPPPEPSLRQVYDVSSPKGDTLYVDDDTGVLYVYVTQGRNSEKTGSLSIMVDENGEPKLYDDYITGTKIKED